MASGTIDWLRTGDEAFTRMLAAIRAAKRSVRLETYIFAASPLGEQFREALVGACQRGVKVRVLIDALGSYYLSDSFWTPLREVDGEVHWFNPLQFRRFTFRDHRKLLVCDDEVAFIGGFNISPEYQGDGVLMGWRDLGLEVGQDMAGELAAAFDAQFARADFEHRPFTRLRRSRARHAITADEGQILLSGPGRGRNAIQRALLGDLKDAKRVELVAAYFLPTPRIRRALQRVARRGGLVRVIVPGKSDVAVSLLASQSLYQRFMRAGVEIYEYQPQILHTKLVVIDQASYVGSANLDARSLHINYELMARLTDAERVGEARTIFAEHLAQSVRVHPKLWVRSRTLWGKLKERWAFFLLARLDPIMMRWQLRRMRRGS